jgi:hypothetical protein
MSNLSQYHRRRFSPVLLEAINHHQPAAESSCSMDGIPMGPGVAPKAAFATHIADLPFHGSKRLFSNMPHGTHPFPVSPQLD